MGVGCLIIVVPFGGILGLVAGYWNGKFISNFIMRVSDVFFGSAGADTGNVRFIHNGTQHDQRHVGSQCFLVALVYEAGIRHSGFHEKRDVYPICGGSRSRQEPHTVQRDIAKHLIAYSYKKVTLDMGWAIMAGATLSYVGMGEQPPTPSSLGAMVSSGVNFLPDQWWMSVFPALAIMIIVLGFNLAGDGIKDMLSSEE